MFAALGKRRVSCVESRPVEAKTTNEETKVSAPMHECELEYETSQETELEAQQFFARLERLAQETGHSPALRRIGLRAAQSVLRAADAAVRCSCNGGGEGECECEAEVNPLRRVYPDALMEHLGHAAAEAHTEAEAEAFIGALIPLAARLLPQIAPLILRAAPGLIPGVAIVARTLRRSPITRSLVRTIPTIVRRTAASMSQQVRQGRVVTPKTAVRTLARQTAQVLGSPARTVEAWRRSRSLDRRHHMGPRGARVSACETACPLCGGR
jgi:hypothetical protein